MPWNANQLINDNKCKKKHQKLMHIDGRYKSELIGRILSSELSYAMALSDELGRAW